MEDIPIVIYRDNKRCVVGSATVNRDGRMIARFTDELILEHLGQELTVAPAEFTLGFTDPAARAYSNLPI